jgi:hypothetical protein
MTLLPTLTDGTAVYTFQTSLDSVAFQLDLEWNDRELAWYLNLYDANLNPLVMGRKVVLGIPLLGRFQGIAGLPPGDLIAFDTSNTDNPPGLLDLGDRVVLLYFTKADLAAVSA